MNSHPNHPPLSNTYESVFPKRRCSSFVNPVNFSHERADNQIQLRWMGAVSDPNLRSSTWDCQRLRGFKALKRNSLRRFACLPTPEKGIQANLGVNTERAGGPCPSNSCFGGEVLGRPGCAFVESCQGHDLRHARADLRESAKLAAFSASPLPSTASWGRKMLCR